MRPTAALRAVFHEGSEQWDGFLFARGLSDSFGLEAIAGPNLCDPAQLSDPRAADPGAEKIIRSKRGLWYRLLLLLVSSRHCSFAYPFSHQRHLWEGTWKISFVLKAPLVRCHVSWSEGILFA